MAQPGFIRHGWGMVGLAGFLDFIATGLFFYSYGVFFPVVSEEFSLGRSATSLGISMFFVAIAISSTQIGPLINRFGLRRMFFGGSIVMGCGLMLISLAPSASLLLPGVIVVAMGASALGQIGPARLVANWFVHRRGMAMGLAAIGISLSGVVMPLLSAWLIELVQWRSALLIYGCACTFFVSLIALTMTVERPADKGLSPDGNPDLPPLGTPVRHVNTRYIMAFLRNPSTWLLSVLFACQFSAISAMLTHMVPMAMDAGLSVVEASQLLSLAAALAVAGKVLFGNAADRMPMPLLLIIAISLQGLGCWLMFTNPDLPYNLVIGACLFGLGFGGAVPLQNYLFAHAFRNSMTMALGLTRPLMLPLQIIGAPLAGWIYDRTGSYELAYWQILAFLIIAAGCALLLPRLLRHQEDLFSTPKIKAV